MGACVCSCAEVWRLTRSGLVSKWSPEVLTKTIEAFCNLTRPLTKSQNRTIRRTLIPQYIQAGSGVFLGVEFAYTDICLWSGEIVG